MDFTKILESIVVPNNVCEYWDVRIESVTKTNIKFDDYDIIDCTTKPSLGAFIRIYVHDQWFYLATTKLKDLSSQIIMLSEKAQKLSIQDSNAKIKPYNSTPSNQQIFNAKQSRSDKISIGKKIELCKSYFDEIKTFNKLKGVVISYADEYKEKHFRSSKDVCYAYDFNQCGLSFSYSVIDGEKKFSDRVHFYSSNIESLHNKNEILHQEITQSHLFLEAKTIKPGNYPVVLSSSVVGVFAHESFGHKSEADFMIGDESMKNIWKIGSKVGNECLSIVDHGSNYGSAGYCPFDDEGYPSQKTYLIKDGILKGRLHNQLTSELFDEKPTGNGRAINFEYEPIVRMTNTYVESGDFTFNELLSKVNLGLYIVDFTYGTGMSSFTIAPRKAYMIRDGNLAEPIRVSVISGSVFKTLDKIIGCSKTVEMYNSVFGGCGKMEQSPLSVGFGGAEVLINEMMVS